MPPVRLRLRRNRQLRQGHPGNRERPLDHQLGPVEAGPVARDGRFGAKTQAAIIKIQRAAGIGADGYVGPQTWATLCYHGAFWGHDMQAKADYRWAKSYAC